METIDHEPEHTTMRDRVSRDGIRMKAAGPRRETDADNWEHDHWRVTLTFRERTYRTDYRMGTGHNGNAPTVEMVLDSLCSDASSADQARSFEDFANEFGYDTDSRRAEALYKACLKVDRELRRFFGSTDRYNAYVYHTERL